MIFYGKETSIGLLVASLPALLSIYYFFILDRKKTALFFLVGSAFLIRLLMISLDPFLHEWDERFHALVAKNMMSNPFKPMLLIDPVFPYKIEDWSYNHIWLHKQPLFLWQMALSMKIFGVNLLALRLPSAILGTIWVVLTYDIARKWLRTDDAAFIAGIVSCFASFALDLTSGRMSLDHNDLAFVFYVTCSFWAFTRYVHSGFEIKWALAIGIFVGLAILNKWLTGFLMFGGWGLYIFLSEYRRDPKKYIHLIVALLTAFVVFLPWQFYISHAFPAESSISYAYNVKHISDALGHPGNGLYHIRYLVQAYHIILILFGLIGVVSIFYSKAVDQKMSVSFLAMVVVLFSFFSIFVAVKMPAYVYPVSSLIIIFISYGVFAFIRLTADYLELSKSQVKIFLCLVSIGAAYFSLRPQAIIHYSAEKNKTRNIKIHNSAIFKWQDEEIMRKYIILNCKAHENIELMFYKNTNAHHFWPPEPMLDSLQAIGYQFAAFQFPLQLLPDYILDDKEIMILQEKDPFK